MSEPSERAALLRWGPVAACAAILIWHSLRYDFVTDDAYISFVYSRNLAEHGELSFNLGHPVEGYTNFLWTVLLALGMLLGISPEVSSRVLGTGFGVGTLVLAFVLTERAIGRRTPWAYLPPLLLALSSGFACWSSGGLETQLFTFLVTLAFERYVAADARPRALTHAAIALALAAMTRPEGLLIAALLFVHQRTMRAIRERRAIPDMDEIIAMVAFVAVWAPWFAWRWHYYGWPFPNTYYVKATGKTTAAYDKALLDAGITYLKVWVEQSRLVFAAPLILAAFVLRAIRTPRFTFVSIAAPVAFVYLAYTASVGGDFMGLHRFIMPIFVIAAIFVALGGEFLSSLVPDHRVGYGVAALLVALFAWSQWNLDERSLHPKNQKERSDRGIDSPYYLMAYTENRAAIGRAMDGCFHDDDFSIFGGAGAQPYFAHMRGIDVFGLVSERIAHEVAPTKPRPGHNKWGPDKLLFEHEPDFAFHCYAIHSSPAIGPLPCGGFWRQRGFEQVTMQIPGLDGKREGRDDRSGGPVADRYTFMVRADRHFQCANLSR